MELPVSYQEKMKALLGADEFEQYKKSLKEPFYRGLRVNESKIKAEEFEKISPFPCAKIPWIPNGYYIPEDALASRHPYYAAGLYYLQEPSAMTPARTLPVNPGDKVLDLCAAPGGKATELAAKTGPKGLLVANDISNSRAKGLLKNLELFGMPQILVTSESPERLTEYFPEYFDKILIDAPCSGEGMFRKDPSMIKSWLEHGPEYYAAIQREILLQAAKMLRPGGLLLYSTCTFDARENEGTIQALLEADPHFSVVPVKEQLQECFLNAGFCPGRPDLIPNGREELKYCFRLYPHKVKGEGHFLALLKKEDACLDKSGEGHCLASHWMTDLEFKKSQVPVKKNIQNHVDSRKKKGTPKGPAGKGRSAEKEMESAAEALFQNFLEQLPQDFPIKEEHLYEFRIQQGQAYALPEALPSIRGLRFLRTGCYLGELEKKRFEPSQALAMALKKEDWPFVLDLPIEDERVLRYLKGETLDMEDCFDQLREKQFIENKDRNGWILVCVNGFPLGWGKLVNGSLRNKYYPGWRW